jgi:hypothetical protein
VVPALSRSHVRGKVFALADIETDGRKGKQAKDIYPIALEAVRRIDALLEIERSINGQAPDVRLDVREQRAAPLSTELERWLRGEYAPLSKHARVAKAIDDLLSPNHGPGFTRFLEDGRTCRTNNAAGRALPGGALGRTSRLFAGSARGGQGAAVMCTLIGTARRKRVDPQAQRADVIACIADMPVCRRALTIRGIRSVPRPWSRPAADRSAGGAGGWPLRPCGGSDPVRRDGADRPTALTRRPPWRGHAQSTSTGSG